MRPIAKHIRQFTNASDGGGERGGGREYGRNDEPPYKDEEGITKDKKTLEIVVQFLRTWQICSQECVL